MKNTLNKVWASLLICMLAVIALTFKGCKDEEVKEKESFYFKHDWVDTVYVENETGTLYYDENTQSWVIVSDSVTNNPNDVIRPIVFSIRKTDLIDEKHEMLQDFIGEKIIFSGEWFMAGPDYGDYDYLVNNSEYFHFKLQSDLEVSLYESRSLDSENHAVCDTKSNTPPAWYFSRELVDGLDYSKSYRVNVFVHVIRTSQGEGFAKDTVSSRIINQLNAAYANTNISFVLTGSDYINSDVFTLMNINSPNYESIYAECMSTNRVTNAINIYKMSGSPFMNGVTGRTQSIPGIAFLLTEHEFENVTALQHEMGHCLGLYHTHHGTYHEGGDSNECAELVDGSNSSTCGDYITDTPADPNEWDGCIYDGTERDANGDIYVPDPTNIMSYANSECHNRFTQKQVERMHQVLRNSTSHHQVATQVNKGITGPSQIGTASTYTYTIDVPSNATVQWSIDCSSYASGSGTPTKYTVSGTGSTITLQNRYPNALSQKYVINATIYLGSGSQRIEYHTSKTIYKISNPAQTGTLSWSSESPCGNYLGTINMSTPNNSTIKLHKGGILTFNYTDVCGAYSYTDTDVFNFEVYNLNVTKEAGANHVFLIQSYATAPSNGKIMLSLMINGSGHMFQIPVELLPCSQMGWNSLEDSLEVETMEIIDEDEIIMME